MSCTKPTDTQLALRIQIRDRSGSASAFLTYMIRMMATIRATQNAKLYPELYSYI